MDYGSRSSFEFAYCLGLGLSLSFYKMELFYLGRFVSISINHGPFRFEGLT